MNAIQNIKFKIKIFFFLCATHVALLTSCNEEDPFVDRTVAPVLLVFDEVTGYLGGGGITAVPSVTKTVNAGNVSDPVALSVKVYQLDKSGILDHTVGIDSLPVSNLELTFSKRDGLLAIAATSDENGKATIYTTWEDLGVTDAVAIANAAPAKSITIPLSWAGSYNGQSFVRYSQVVFKKN